MVKTLIVVDSEEQQLDRGFGNTISFDSYLKDYPKRNEPKTRIINLCDTGHYLSKGYYCSLLAEARQHTILPSVRTINELGHLEEEGLGLGDFKRELSGFDLSTIQAGKEILVYFGTTDVAGLQKLSMQVFRQYPAPILKLTFLKKSDNFSLHIDCASYSALADQQRSRFLACLTEFTNTVWRIHSPKKHFRWDMAILVNPTEKVPTSDKEALSRFVKAANKYGINAELLSIDQIQNISYFDALFIRETTAIDHYTYRLASKAENNGLIVMDDPTSILRCCNKVYLHDAFNYQKVPSLRTEVISDNSDETLDKLEETFGYPVVLKMPEGSFSKGVYKLNARNELRAKLQELLATSALVLVQEYLYTEYDWRIGLLSGRPIYACRYLMARNHWQIYNHTPTRAISGGFETLPTFEVPRVVLDAAVKAGKIIGNGLYGVDVKHHDNRAYVLEVNDNPSIDHKVESGYLGDELYMQIMGEFHRQLEAHGR